MIFSLIISLVVIQRLVELVIAKRNERQLKNRGAIEFGTEHYPWMVLLHFGFFTFLIMEVVGLKRDLSSIWYLWLTLFAIAQMGRVWVISSLGEYWNTKIVVLPNAEVIAKGPYKYIKHPNYVIVATEILVLSLLFNAFFTAIIFSLLNAWMMWVRIHVEEQALKEHTEYAYIFQKK